MKTLLIGINAKYIHPNLAIRLLKKNTRYDVDIKEFTIKENIKDIIDYILTNKYDTVAFSCYIWNIEIIKNILNLLKDKQLVIILGGPEVSYNAYYYLENNLASYIIKNEGEEAFDLLLHYLDGKCQLDEVPNLYYKGGYTFDKYVDINNIKPAYDLLDDMQNKIVYFETSRGCPYKCGYCMASLDNKVRFFDIEMLKKELLLLKENGARVIKFLDRTFNANKKNFIDLIDFIIKIHTKGQSYQFEITGDLLSEEIIHYINKNAPKNLFRFEIGIQSTNIKSNLSVGRIQNNEKLFHNIKLIQDANIIDLHLDLIAGLPYEDFKSFENTFNEVIRLHPLELQLGFLKLLHGTRLKDEALKYNYRYNENAPYDIISNDFMSENDILEIHKTEEAFDVYYNSNIMKNTMSLIIDNIESPFNFFHLLGDICDKTLSLEGKFKLFDDFILNLNIYPIIHKNLIIDYLNYFKVKPKVWWTTDITPKEKNKILRELYENNKINIDLLDLYKYSILVVLEDTYIIGLYKPGEKEIIVLDK